MTQLPASTTVGLWLPLLIACDISTWRHYPRQGRWRAIWLLGPWTVLGILIGRSMFGLVDERWIKLTVGLLGCAFIVLQFVRAGVQRYSSARQEAWRPRWFHAMPFGLAAGVSTALAHAAGGIVNMFLLPQKLEPREFVGTCVRYYFIFNTLKIPIFSLKMPLFLGGSEPLITVGTLKACVWLLPLAPLGAWAGAWLNRRLDARKFNIIIYIILAATSLSLVVKNL
jgi:uncharacterized membrane protein YfcA